MCHETDGFEIGYLQNLCSGSERDNVGLGKALLRKTESLNVNSTAAVVWPWVTFQALLVLHHPDL